MNNFFLLLFLSIAYINPVLSQSGLLESVKKNPNDAVQSFYFSIGFGIFIFSSQIEVVQ